MTVCAWKYWGNRKGHRDKEYHGYHFRLCIPIQFEYLSWYDSNDRIIYVTIYVQYFSAQLLKTSLDNNCVFLRHSRHIYKKYSNMRAVAEKNKPKSNISKVKKKIQDTPG